ncbi:MAG: hypothetical protein HY820_16520 [Acidobacteria bacterium]|nr:hypothetical protein [Acidobacteriota bacterium]
MLKQSREGDAGARELLANLIHREMRKLAGGLMRAERAGPAQIEQSGCRGGGDDVYNTRT